MKHKGYILGLHALRLFHLALLTFLVGCIGAYRGGHFSVPRLTTKLPDNSSAGNSREQLDLQTLRFPYYTLLVNMRNDIQTANSLWWAPFGPVVPLQSESSYMSRYSFKNNLFCPTVSIQSVGGIDGLAFVPTTAKLGLGNSQAKPASFRCFVYHKGKRTEMSNLSTEAQVIAGGKIYQYEICFNIPAPDPTIDIYLDLRSSVLREKKQIGPLIYFSRGQWYEEYKEER